MKTALLSLIVVATLIASPIYEDISIADQYRLPGWYPTKLKLIVSTDPEHEKKQIKLLYQELFPGALGDGFNNLKFVPRPNGMKDGCLGCTEGAHRYQRDPSYRPMGGDSMDISIEIYDVGKDGTWDTVRHEMAHGMNFSIKSRGSKAVFIKTPPFIEEGMAVAASWLLNPLLAHNEDMKVMEDFFKAIESEARLKQYIEGSIRQEKIRGMDYQPAGFFMMHVLTYAGPSTAKSMFSSEDPDQILKDLRIALEAKGITYNEFIHLMFVNGQKWKKGYGVTSER